MTRVRNAIWLTACRLTGDVLNLVLFVLISRKFGPSGVGAYSYAFAVATFGFVIGCLGIEEYGLRQYSRLGPDQRPKFLGELLGTQALMVAIAVAALGIYLAATRSSASMVVMVCSLGVYQVTAACVATLFIPAMAEQRMLWPAFGELSARTVAFSVTGFAILFEHAELATALMSFPLAALLWMSIALRAVRRFAPRLKLSFSAAASGRVLRILWSFALLEIFAQLFARIGVITLTLAVSEAAAGVFATGLRLIEVALMPLSFLGVAAYPRLSQLYVTDPVAFRRSALDLMWLMLLGGGAVAWGLYYVAPSLLVPVLGERFAGAETTIQTMAVFALVQAIEVGLGRVLLCADRQSANALFVASGAVLSLILNALLVPRLGVPGAIYAGTAAYIVIDLLCIAALRAPLTASALTRLFLSLAGSLGVAGGLTAVLALHGASTWPQAMIFLAAFAAVAAWAYRYRHRRLPTSPPFPWSTT